STSDAFPVYIDAGKDVGDLKDAVKAKKAKKAIFFSRSTHLWNVSVPVVATHKHENVTLDSLDSKEELDPFDNLSDVFDEKPHKRTVHKEKELCS
ncbi:hypothetical protein BGZ65_003155, partial [Modicella reniformis]